MKTFPKIALSLSGGGYRAASFHLGTLETLYELDLLDSVKILSTVSGGTITGTAYAISLADQISFTEFSDKFKVFLKSTNMIAKALEKLPESVAINQSKAMPSLIRAAASVYASENLFSDKTLDHLLRNCPQLEDLSFNATDFRTGNSFRFQKSNSKQVYSGNKYAQISADVNKRIRLADIVAASSCFPSGFEPIRFPADFVWDEIGLDEIKGNLGTNFNAEIPLMDGGVFDNQGIDSIFNINQRKGQNLDLIIVSDTDQRDPVMLEFPAVENGGFVKLKYVGWLVLMLQAASLITMTAIIIDAFSTFQTGSFNWIRGIFLYLIPFGFALAVVIAAFYLRSITDRLLKKFNAESGINLWQYLKNLTLPQLIEFAGARIKSLVVMSGSVFMKRVRDLSYSRIYADLNLREKIISNQIYDLNKNIHLKPGWEKFITEAELAPSEKLRKSALRAESYATNLWFLDSDELENLIFCGRATMCYNILDFLLERRLEKLTDTASAESDLFIRAEKMWLDLNDKNP